MPQPRSMQSISKDTTLCISLAGRPGNFGTRFHNFLYAELGLDYVYKAFTTTDLAAAIGGVRALGIRGCAVSMPFKEACIPLLDELTPSAAAIGSVNTIVNDGGFLRAYNTDYLAVGQLIAQYQLAPETPFALRGSGGMAKAVAAAFRDAGFGRGVIVARHAEKGSALAQECGYSWQAELGEFRPELLVNVTPIGMAGGAEAERLAFKADAVEHAQLVFDVVAMPAETPLIRAARAAGKRVISGAEVASLQALEQFVLYTGVRPSPEQAARAAAFAHNTAVHNTAAHDTAAQS
ncbi:shikimate 5-dehydrogenase [Deinococcus detaillensis]|uniref:Shikimate 5-dehydrogenase n=1 Tax=Deinococcus detaillensis TaxID=2592048 RepID=A0A553UWA7_9DEIO|nr:shikimate 5-dehydrogenase [Deinococcus detaillensis]TSA84486.1 shikimate 5-dehydrogenase [Deinococcus detaillensis]